jgi:hypothetical protein
MLAEGITFAVSSLWEDSDLACPQVFFLQRCSFSKASFLDAPRKVAGRALTFRAQACKCASTLPPKNVASPRTNGATPALTWKQVQAAARQVRENLVKINA